MTYFLYSVSGDIAFEELDGAKHGEIVITTLQELNALIKKYGQVIVSDDRINCAGSIRVYDDLCE